MKRKKPLVLWSNQERSQGWRPTPDPTNKAFPCRDIDMDSYTKSALKAFGHSYGYDRD